jgi:hypothetical protein
VGAKDQTPRTVARIDFSTPKGSDKFDLLEGDVIAFGRGSECRIRFGHAPVMDSSIPRVAGTLTGISGRVIVDSSSHVGHRALEFHVGQRKTQIPLGQGVSLVENFDLLVRGEHKNWLIQVKMIESIAPGPSNSNDEPVTAHVNLELTDVQWKVLRAYYEPLLHGFGEPASHREVAVALGFHLNTVRNRLYEIRDLMYHNGLQMPETKDARLAVVETARIHGIIRE